MDDKARIEKANEIKALVDTLKPVKQWGFTSSVWARPDGDGGYLVRVYVNDKKRSPAAVLIIERDGSVRGEWKTGHSLTRNEIKAAISVL